MLVLGWNGYVFNSAACLFADGRLVAAAQEERFTREKNTGAFPVHAIAYCLQEAGAVPEDLDHVCFHWRPFHRFHRRLALIARYLPDSVRYWDSHSGRWGSMVLAEQALRRAFGSRSSRRLRFRFHRVAHHVCHAASAFLVSPFDDAAILTVDGSGEMASTTFGVGEGPHVRLLGEVLYPHSLGYLYVSLTHYLGFKPDQDEYKVMGLAPYGGPSSHYDALKEIVRLEPNGRFSFDLSYFNYQRGIRTPWVSPRFVARFGPVRGLGEPLEPRHASIAWALQRRVEDVLFHLATHLRRVTGKRKLCLAGGVALNAVGAGLLLRSGLFDDVWVQPAANDAGTGIGSAAYVRHAVLGRPRDYVMDHVHLGPAYDEAACLRALEGAGVVIEKLDEGVLVDRVAGALTDGEIVAWFQGRMELGPRSLGARSILADPRRAAMKDVLNAKVKHRESFRPFAPVVPEEVASDWFECDRPAPFMVTTVPVRAERQAAIPAVVHVDGTARIQTLRRNQNPRLWSVVTRFGELTGVPVLVNTSLNVMGEPIVCRPEEAVRCFLATGIDRLAMGNLLVSKGT